jgi:hypothetical protein
MSSSLNQGPAWLGPFLSNVHYFDPCKLHPASRKNDSNFFCVTCQSPSLCKTCVVKDHEEHHILQVRKSSHHDAVRIDELKKTVDLTQIQPYVINGARIVHLNKRPQGKQQKADNACVICQRNLMENNRFCSLGCKREAAKYSSSISLTPGLVTRPPVHSPVKPLAHEPTGFFVSRKKRSRYDFDAEVAAAAQAKEEAGPPSMKTHSKCVAKASPEKKMIFLHSSKCVCNPENRSKLCGVKRRKDYTPMSIPPIN